MNENEVTLRLKTIADIGGFNAVLSQLSDMEKRVGSLSGAFASSTSKQAAAKGAFDRTGASMKAVGDAGGKAVGDLKRMGDAVTEAGEAAGKSKSKFDGLGSALALGTGVGAGIAAVGMLGNAVGGVVGVLGDAISVGMSFEKQLSAISAVSGATAEEMTLVHDKALQLGKDTAFSALEAAAGMEELLKAGVSVEGVLGGAADAATSLAAAGGIDLAKAAEIASAAMNNFGLSADSLPGVADKIAGAANASAISVEDFGYSLSASGAVANLAGVTFDDLSVAITAMGNAGIKGSDAGTSLKTMMMNLIPTTKTQIAAFAELGLLYTTGGDQIVGTTTKMKSAGEVSKELSMAVAGLDKESKAAFLTQQFGASAFDETGKKLRSMSELGMMAVKGNMAIASSTSNVMSATKQHNLLVDEATGKLKPFGEIAGILSDKLKDLSDSEKMVALEAMFGSDAIRAAAVIADTGAEGWDKLSESMGKVTAAEVAAERLNNLQGAADAFGGSLETLKIVVVEKLLPSFTGMVQSGSDVLNKFTEFASTQDFQNFVKEIGEKAAAFVSGAGAEIVDFVSTLIDALKPRSSETEIDRMAMAGENLNTSKVDDMRAAIDEMRDALSQAGPAVQDLSNFLGDLRKWMEQNESKAKLAGKAFDLFTGILGRVSASLAFFGMMAKAAGVVIEGLAKKYEELKTAFSKINWGDIGRGIINGIKAGIDSAWQGFLSFFGAKVDAIPKAAEKKLLMQSPSKVFAAIGKNIMLGLALGIQYGGAPAEDAMTAAIAKVNVKAREELAKLDQGLRDFYAKTLSPEGTWGKLVQLWTSTAFNDLNTMDFGHLDKASLPEPPDWRILAGDPDLAKKAWDKFWEEAAALEDKRNKMTVGERLPDDAEGRHYSGLLKLEHKYTNNPEMTEAVDKMKKIEKNRHELAMKYIAEEREAGAKLWQERQDQIELERELRAMARAAIAAAQAGAEKREDLISDAIMEHIEEQARKWADAHADRLAALASQKGAEEDRHAAALKGFEAERKAQNDHLAEWEAGVKAITDRGKEMGIALGRLKIDLDLDSEDAKLDALTSRLSDFEDALGKLDVLDSGDAKGAAQRAAKAAREKIMLTTEDQRRMLQSVKGTLTGGDLRTAELLLQGHALKADKVRDLMARIGEQIKGQIGAQEGVIDAKQAQIDALQKEIDLNKQSADEAGLAFEREKARVDLILSGIDARESAEKERNAAEMARIAALVAAENAAYDRQMKTIEEMKRTEAQRHTDKMRQIGEEYAMRLALLDHTPEEIAAMVAAAAEEARKIGEEAAAAFAAMAANAGKAKEETAELADEAMRLGSELKFAAKSMEELALSADTVAATIVTGWEDATAAVRTYYDTILDYGKKMAPKEERRSRLNASTRRGRGGFRAGFDWEEWHYGNRGGDTEGTGGDGTGIGGTRIGGPAVPNPWRYGAPPGHGMEPDPWRYGADPKAGAGPLVIDALDLTVITPPTTVHVHVGTRELKELIVDAVTDRSIATRVESKLADVRAVKSSTGPTS